MDFQPNEFSNKWIFNQVYFQYNEFSNKWIFTEKNFNKKSLIKWALIN